MHCNVCMNSSTAGVVVYACVEGAAEADDEGGIVAVKPKLKIVFKYSTHDLLCMLLHVKQWLRHAYVY